MVKFFNNHKELFDIKYQITGVKWYTVLFLNLNEHFNTFSLKSNSNVSPGLQHFRW